MKFWKHTASLTAFGHSISPPGKPTQLGGWHQINPLPIDSSPSLYGTTGPPPLKAVYDPEALDFAPYVSLNAAGGNASLALNQNHSPLSSYQLGPRWNLANRPHFCTANRWPDTADPPMPKAVYDPEV